MSERTIEAVTFSTAGLTPGTPVFVRDQPSTTSTRTSVASSAVTVTILAANANRLGATVFNESTQVLFLALGAGGTTTDYTLQMIPNSYYEVPADYVGIITGVWAVANGFARVTELTP